MNVLITGGAGFIGSHLAEAILKVGDHVYAIDDLSTGSLKNIRHLIGCKNFTFFNDTILNEQMMYLLIDKCEIVYHLAAAVGVRLIVEQPIHTIETNVHGTEMILKIADKYKRKVIITSTSEIYGKSNQVPFGEDDDRVLGSTKNSRWSYSSSKAIDEFLALAYYQQLGLPIVIVRLFNTVGPKQTGQYGMVVPRFVKTALLDQPITVYGSGKQSRCFAHVSDVIDGFINLAKAPNAVGEIFNIGSQEEITIENLAKKIKKLTQSKSEIVYVPYEEIYGPGFDDMQRRVPDLRKIKKNIGYQPKVSLDETLQDVIDHFRKELEKGELPS